MGGQKGCQRQNILLKSGLEWEGSQPCGNMSKCETYILFCSIVLKYL